MKGTYNVQKLGINRITREICIHIQDLTSNHRYGGPTLDFGYQAQKRTGQ
jgi:hypothetical protein